jgi:hypothetical protein
MPLFPAPQRVNEEVFGKEEFGTLLIYIEDKVKFLKGKCKGIREDLMPKWVRIYRGIPSEKSKTWPWPGASNLVIQVAGMFCDELLSRVMAIYSTDPLFNCKPLGDFDSNTNTSGNDQSQDIEYFLQDCAHEPEELDLYRVEETGYSSAIRFGTGIFKFPWEYVVEQQATYIGGGTEEGTKVNYQWAKDGLTRRDGPHPENVPLSDWSIDPRFANANQADFKIHTLHLDYYQLKSWMAHPDVYSKETIEKVLEQPDKIPEYRRQLEEQKEVESREENRCSSNYDIEECWFSYNKDGKIYKLIAYYHEGTNLHLGCIFNMYPDNEEPFEDAKFAYDDDTYFGYGACEMLESYQREVSETHNWRIDNRRFATTGVGRINKNSKLSSILQLYPGVLIPADEGEVEALAFGQNAMQYGTEDETQTLQLAAGRIGVDPAEGGSGGGTVNAKKGVYSAQGTAMSMQSRNNRNNLRMSDMRSCHVRMGRKLLKMYAHFGLGNKIRKYGDRAELIKKALENIKSQRLGLVIKPSTASLNKEMEKQNEILLSATLERLYQTDMQAMQMLATQGLPPEMFDLIKKQIRARNALCKSLLRAFDHTDYERLLAVPEFMLQERQDAIRGSQQQQQPNNAGAVNQAPQQAAGAEGMVPVGAGQPGGAVPIQ